ncbi:MAG: PilX N-terminal domain-containing pilus assembly protein [Candidatus Thiodiazotropha endolucinida]
MTDKQILTYPNRHSQHGAALVISLIMLTVITILSLSAMRSTNLDTKIAVNQQLREVTFQAAENSFSRLTGPVVDIDLPNSIGAENAVTTQDYYQSVGVEHQPDFSADVTVQMLEISRRYKFSGFPLNVLTVMYQADAQGVVENNNTKTVNRMQVALIRN